MKMDLGEFLSKIDVIPREQDMNLDKIVKLKFPEVRVKTDTGLKNITTEDFHIKYIAFLKIVGNSPNSTFGNLYENAINKYGFPDAGSIADLHLRMLEQFKIMGAIKTEGKIHGQDFGKCIVYGLPERAGDTKFNLNKQGLKSIKVLNAAEYISKEGKVCLV